LKNREQTDGQTNVQKGTKKRANDFNGTYFFLGIYCKMAINFSSYTLFSIMIFSIKKRLRRVYRNKGQNVFAGGLKYSGLFCGISINFKISGFSGIH
jgi:hypothetical protein